MAEQSDDNEKANRTLNHEMLTNCNRVASDSERNKSVSKGMVRDSGKRVRELQRETCEIHEVCE
jgi:hypothetical protein